MEECLGVTGKQLSVRVDGFIKLSCTHTHTHTHAHVHTHTHTHTHAHAHTHTLTHARTHARTHTHHSTARDWDAGEDEAGIKWRNVWE